MLLAAGLPLPRTVFGHGWLLVGGEKMSKSKLTAIPASEITDVFGSDAFRYYFLRGDPVRPGRVVLLGGHGGALQVRAVRPVRQPGVAADLDGRAIPRRRAAAGRRRAGARAGAGPGRRRRRTPRSTGSTCRARSSRPSTSSGWSTSTWPSRSRGRPPRTRTARPTSTACSTRRPRRCAPSPCCSTRSCPSRPTLLWAALGAEPTLGTLAAQRIQDAGTWGQLPGGASVQTLAPLFPRIETRRVRRRGVSAGWPPAPGPAADRGGRRPLPPRHPGGDPRRGGRGAQPRPGARRGRGGQRPARRTGRL